MRAGRESQIPILPLGPSGYLSACLLSLIAAMLAPGWRVVPVCVLVLIMAAAFCRAGLDPLRRMWLWVLVSLLILPSALLGEGSGWTILGLGLSSEGLAAGLQMALRAVTVLIAVSGLAASVSVGELASLLERVGFKGLGFAVGVAVNMLPTVQEMATISFHALRLRGGLRRHRLETLRLLLVTIVVNTLRHADDIVSAAEARAFSVERTRPPFRWGWQRGDALLAGALCVLIVAMLRA